MKMYFCIDKMCSINLRLCLKIIKLKTKANSHKINYSNLPLPQIYFFNKQCSKYFHIVTNNFDYNSASKISSIGYLKYSTSAVEIPPSTPILTDEIQTSDTFGSLGGLKYEKVELDEEELEEENKQKYLGGKVPRKFKPSLGQYAKMIKNYVSKGDLNSAEQVIQMCINNRDKPSDYMYSLLVFAFAMQGDINKCYKYYSDMKSRKYKIKNCIYTSLFNACAICPDTTKALCYLEKVRDYMNKKGETMNHAHYNVLIKAYGRHNEFEKAENLIKYMLDKKLKIGISTLNSLMYAANTNTKSGLKHIFSIWQFMRQKQIPPDIFTYHLLLRGIRDTHFGDFTFNDLFISNQNNLKFLIDENKPDLLKSPPVISSLPFDNIKQEQSSTFDALIDPPILKSVLITQIEQTDLKNNSDQVLPASIGNINLDAVLKQNKLILFGGFQELLQKMKNDKIQPDIKTITYLVDLIPNSTKAEEALIKYSNSHNIKLDISFFNTLIRKRCYRGAKREAKEVINYIHKADLKPNILTYSALAIACIKINECYELISTMQSTGTIINKYVAHPLFIFAMQKIDFKFILFLMEKIKKERVILDEQFFTIFDEFQQKMTKMIKTKHHFSTTEKFKTEFSKFNMRYKTWQEDMGRKILTERE